jgi:hypothetical protein
MGKEGKSVYVEHATQVRLLYQQRSYRQGRRKPN